MTIDMTCAECAERLPEYIAGPGDAGERERIERHIQTCDRCQAELKLWRAIGEAVEQDVATVPPDTREITGWSWLVVQLPVRRNQPVAPSEPSFGGHPVRDDHLRTIELDENPSSHPRQSFQPPANRPTRRWMAPIGVVAASLIVALGAVLFSSQAGRRSTPALGGATPGPVNVQPGPPLPKDVTMTNVTLAGPGEYWATGAITNSATRQPDTGVILRFSDGKWERVGDALPSYPPNGIAMVSATEGWAWGANFYDTSDIKSVILHISGGAWQRVTVAGVNAKGSPQFVRMRSATEGWLVMQNPKEASGDTTPSSLFQYVNGVWRPVQSPLLAYWDLAAVGPGEAWILGGDADDTVTIVHLTTGKGVVTLCLPKSENIWLNDISAATPNDVWATGVHQSPTPGAAHAQDFWTPALYHYDGASWESVAPVDMRVPAAAQHFQLIPYSGMWATRSATVSVFAGRHQPIESRVQALYQLDRGTWQEVPLPYSDLVGLNIIPDASTASDVWAIGGYSVWTTQPNSSTVSGGTHLVLLHYLNGEWTEYGR